MPDQMEDLLGRMTELEQAFKRIEERRDSDGNGVTAMNKELEQRLEELTSLQEAQHRLQEWSEQFQQWTQTYVNLCLQRISVLEKQVEALQPALPDGEGLLPVEEAGLQSEEEGSDLPMEVTETPSATGPGLEDLRSQFLERIESLEHQVAELRAAQGADPATGSDDLTPVLPAAPLPPAFHGEALADEALAREEEERVEDSRALEASRAELEQWGGLCRRLQEGIAGAQARTGEILASATQAKEALPASVQERLEGRQRGLELIGKMLARLLEKPTLDVPDAATPPLPTFSREEWATLLASETEESSARKRIEAQLRRLGTERFRVVAEYRALADGTRRRFRDFLTRQAFPVLDGVDDGERHSAELQSQFGTEDDSTQETLSRWMQAYSQLRAQLHEMLAQVGVTPMVVQTGEEIDYERHEPFDTEPDPDLPNEHIKSLVRNGYEYRDDDETVLLRPAQVIVVKN